MEPEKPEQGAKQPMEAEAEAGGPVDPHDLVSSDDEIDYSIDREFFDPALDDTDERWAKKQRKGCTSDVVLSCPACFTTLCLDCQSTRALLLRMAGIQASGTPSLTQGECWTKAMAMSPPTGTTNTRYSENELPLLLLVCDGGFLLFKHNVKLITDTGLDACRFSISWSRIIPNGRGAVNPKGLEYYNNLMDEVVRLT